MTRELRIKRSARPDRQSFELEQAVQDAADELIGLATRPFGSSVVRTTASVSAKTGQIIMADTNASDLTVSIPGATKGDVGSVITIKKTKTANTVNIVAGTSTIDGSGSTSLTTLNDKLVIVATGENEWTDVT